MVESERFHLSIITYVRMVFSKNLVHLSSLAGNKTDIFFAPLKTRFIRITILDNYGGDDIRIQGIGFYGVDMRLVELLREYGLERSLQTLLANVR